MDTPSEANTTIPATMDPKIVPVSEDPVPNNQPVETHRRPPPPPPPPHFPYPHPGAFMNFLPPGWTEHTGPGGQLYWYNSMTGQSSWQRPLMPPGGFMGHPGMVPIAPPFVPPVVPKPAVKKTKKKIPGTHWLLVRTDDGLEFYFDKEKKQSVWEMPKELEEPIAKMKQEEKEAETKTPKEPVPTKPAKPTKEAEVGEKRKVEEETDEAKRQKTEDMEATEMTEEDIMWQLQNMDPDEIEDLGLKKEEPVVPQSAPVIAVAPVVEPRDSALSEEERVELFTEMLTEKDISPYSTWEKELPKLIGDRRYSLVQHSKRKNLFNNYCRLLAQEIKLKKANQKTPEESYADLLEEEANEKMYWEDFRRKVKDDERFKAVRETKLRELMFKDYVKMLRKDRTSGTRRREEEYMELLKSTREIRVGMRWRDCKRILEHDKRYQAIDSKDTREDLFRDYLETL